MSGSRNILTLEDDEEEKDVFFDDANADRNESGNCLDGRTTAKSMVQYHSTPHLVHHTHCPDRHKDGKRSRIIQVHTI